ncbi:MAG: hypothetical protein ACT443_06595 [Gemmatimonadota bacterium]
MQPTDAADLRRDRLAQRVRDHGHAILVALAAPHGNLSKIDVDILETNIETSVQPQACTTKRRTHPVYASAVRLR